MVKANHALSNSSLTVWMLVKLCWYSMMSVSLNVMLYYFSVE